MSPSPRAGVFEWGYRVLPEQIDPGTGPDSAHSPQHIKMEDGDWVLQMFAAQGSLDSSPQALIKDSESLWAELPAYMLGNPSRVRPGPWSSLLFRVARRPWLPLLQLLLLLLSGSQADPEAKKLQKVAGQTRSLRCQYPPTAGPYQRKSWRKEASALVRVKLVTSSGPQKLAGTSQFSMWDNPEASFFIVTMTGLQEVDSGHYWCRIYTAFGNSFSKSKKFHLTVSPGPITFPDMSSFRPPSRALSTASASTQGTWTTSHLVSSQTQNCLSPAPGASPGRTAASPQGNSTVPSDPAASSALVHMLCGLLVAKSLVLSALLGWALRERHGQPKWRCLASPGARPAQAGPHERLPDL
ncbi:natural cytotoxicity triggering receptor 2 [Dasypus novemcinctus]|uniref:natural cytotoxicity triggering receptor 2 n=1 Tax=Dasypus novemcinctus TaxID=9361 RepID=UPI00265F0C29|nr:natural cytotoxicity triggering receptor 2 [Dasypus novemcinctus]